MDTVCIPKSNAYSNNVRITRFRKSFMKLLKIIPSNYKQYIFLYEKFEIKFAIANFDTNPKFKIISSPLLKLKNHQGSFIILNTNYIKKQFIDGVVFDSNFINGIEDSYLWYKYLNNSNIKISSYRIGFYVGSSLGIGLDRLYRNLINEIYFESLVNL